MSKFCLKWLLSLSLTTGLGLIGPACGGGGEPLVVGSCDAMGVSCTEYIGSGYDAMTIQTSCADVGTFSLGPCYGGGALGKCTHSEGTEYEKATYYYIGIADTFQENCEGSGGIWTLS